MRAIVKVFVVCALGLAVLFGVAGLAVPPASATKPKPTGGTGKTLAQCDADLTKCKSDCVKNLVDVYNIIEQCKWSCTDHWVLCIPVQSQGGGERTPFAPLLPKPPASQ